MEVLQRTANRGSISTGEYEIDNSIKIEPANDEGLYFTPSSTTNTDTFTFSCWFKRTEISNQINTLFGSYTDGSNHALFRFKTDDTLELRFVTTGTGKILVSDRLFRDTSAWYHMVLAVDTTDGTTANRVKVYINGKQITLTGDYPSQNQDCIGINTASKAMNVGYLSNFANVEFAGYIAEAHHIDGSQLASTEFGEFDDDSGIWKPKAYTGSYGTNGFYLDFEDNTSAGKDTSGNNNNFSDANLNAADHATDTPTNNFCTWTRLWTFTKVAGIENGGTSTNADFNASTWRGAKGTMGVSRGKWYWEQKASGNDTIVGWQTDNCVPDSGTNSHNVISTIAYYEAGNFLWIKDSTSGRNADTMSGSYAGGQIDGMALNLDSSPQTVTFYRNGSAILSNRNIDGLANQTLFPMTSHYNQTSDANFGGYTNFTISSAETDENGYGTFEYAPPSGYYALCSKNLAEYG